MSAWWQSFLGLHAREKELIGLAGKYRDKAISLGILQSNYRSLKQQADQATELERQCLALSRQVKKLPSLQARRAALEEAMKKHEEEQKALTAQEYRLSQWVGQLQERMGWITLAGLKEQIESSRQELDCLSRQLGEKRSILDRMLGRNRRPES